MIEGSIPLTNVFGSRSRRLKNMWIRWIRIRIRNTACRHINILTSLLWKKFVLLTFSQQLFWPGFNKRKENSVLRFLSQRGILIRFLNPPLENTQHSWTSILYWIQRSVFFYLFCMQQRRRHKVHFKQKYTICKINKHGFSVLKKMHWINKEWGLLSLMHWVNAEWSFFIWSQRGMTLSVCWANLSDAESTSGWDSPNAESIWNYQSTTPCPIWHTGLVNTKKLT